MIKLLVIFFLLVSCSLHAENSKTQSGYAVHYIALSTDVLTPQVARNYQISRSKTKGFVNIAVLKLHDNDISTPVTADIIITAKNFYGQNKKVDLRKISENDGAIYYIGTFSVSSREIVNFKAQIQPRDTAIVIDIKFEQEFYTD